MTTRPASSPLPAPPATGVAAAEPIRIGVASDLHVSRLDDIKARTFERALRFFDRSGVDAVVVPGDLADNGRVCELEMVKAAWDAVFPANRGGDGRPVEPVFLYGNHDHEGWTYEPDVRRDDAGRPVPPADALVLDMAGHWERVFGEPYATVSRKVVKGWTFVCGQYEGWGTAVQEKVRTWLEEHDAEVRGDRPFFYVQHVHPKGTVATLPAPPGGRVVCHLGETLARYPNAICLSGHSHGVLTDEAMFCWHGEYVALEGSSLKFGSTRVRSPSCCRRP